MRPDERAELEALYRDYDLDPGPNASLALSQKLGNIGLRMLFRHLRRASAERPKAAGLPANDPRSAQDVYLARKDQPRSLNQASEYPPEACYNVNHVFEEAAGALDPARRPEAGCGEADYGPEGRDREGRDQAPEAETGQERLKQSQYLLGPIGKGIECFNNVPSFAHRYISGEAGLEVYIRIRPTRDDGNARHFIARICRKAAHSDLNASVHWVALMERIDALRGEAFKSRGNVCQMNAPVLIDVVDAVEPAEDFKGMTNAFSSGLRPKIERLEAFELISIGAVHPLIMDTVSPFAFFDDDREMDAFNNCSIGGFDAVEMTQSQLPGQVVEGAADIMNSVSNNETPVIRDIYHALNADNDSPIFRLVLAPERDRATISINFLDLDLQRVYVRFSTFELSPGAGKI